MFKYIRYRSHYFVYAVVSGFLLGIVLTEFLPFSYLLLYSFFIGAVFLFVYDMDNPWVRIIAFGIAFISIGILRVQMTSPPSDNSHIQSFADQQVTMIGVVSREVEVRTDRQKLIIDREIINGQLVDGRVLVTAPLLPEYTYGDRLELSGYLEAPEPFDGFAYDRYLERYGIYALMYYPNIRVQEVNAGNPILASLLNLKTAMVRQVNRLLPEPQASFLGGLLWGARRSIPAEVLEHFNATGTTHLIALSGYNITVLGLIIFYIAPWLGIGRKRAFWLVISIILFFVIITGMPASVVRAAIMGILVLFTHRFGGGVKVGLLIMLSAGVMCLINPYVLTIDLGFQLSFLATLGLVYLVPVIERYFRFIPQQLGLRESIVATVAAVLMTTPLIALQFGRFSTVTIFANALILAVIPLAMGFGFLGTLMSFFLPPVGQVIMWITYIPLTYVIQLTSWLSDLPYASLDVPYFPIMAVTFFYIIIGLAIIIYHAKIWHKKMANRFVLT